MFAGILALYLFLPTKNYYWDGIDFAQHIEDVPSLDPSLLHPNHLFYNVVGYLVYRAVRSTGLQVRAVAVLQVLNSLISVMSAYVLLRILLDCFKSIYVGVVLTLLFAFSATWWKFSTDADSYILSVFFLLVSFYLILPLRKPRPFAVALAHTLSMFFHQLAVLFFPVILLGLILQASSHGAKSRLIPALKYSLTASLMTFSVFCYSFYLAAGGFAPKPFLSWVTTFSPEHGFTFNAWNNLTYTLRGHSRLFVGGRLDFLRDSMNAWMLVLVIALSLVTVIFFYKLIRGFKELKAGFRSALNDDGRFKPLRLLCAVWIGCYIIFLFFFIPQNTFYRLFYLPAIIILMGTFLAPYEATQNHIRRFRAALFVVLIASVNLTFLIYPYAQVSANPTLKLALAMNKVWRPGAVVYFAARNSDNALVRYFNPSVSWIEADPGLIESELPLLERENKDAWLETSLIDRYQATPEGRRWLESHTLRRPEYELVNDKYRVEFYQLRLPALDSTQLSGK
jgi:hypothetical protein